MSKFVFGIDLGTTYSCIAYVDENGIPTVIKNNEGTNTTPSVVNFASSGEVVVGGVAKESAVIEPNNTVEFVKRLMGKTDFAINYDGEDKSPEEISSYILRKLAKDASEQLDTEVKDVVITCPAYFGLAERKATKNAGEMAGLNVLEVISEPTAAALYYGCTKASDERTFLVYDLGGGTFDVTIMRISSEKIEII
ncbi:Hsp70 family protein, partial [Zhenpiania hominis]|uniref:Hsp70 family protein n=1 Tax=Zhenpiania hominis TaxID=2763644 RepID=UPI0039F64406